MKLLSQDRLVMALPVDRREALKMKQQRFVIDGEICMLDVRGISDFDALHSNRTTMKPNPLPDA